MRIIWRVGPYVVTPETAARVAEEARFRHFKPEELAVGKRFVKACLIEGFYYFDVYLLTPKARAMLEGLPREQWGVVVPWLPRIDIVIDRPGEVWIIEVKERLRRAGIGELIDYRVHYQEFWKPGKPIHLGYAAAIDDPDLHPTLKEHGITWWIV